ncbi:MAG: electron transfer flavoprotein subunit beta/FixA family protein [Desulfobacterales bacterium]|nr:electron transfer flavoprotein subunit beta/FixA family protein [Desulfobacterales bacterium]
MEILVCIKGVPDLEENEIEIKSDGTDIVRDDLVYSINEWDNYAVEEAISITEDKGGSVTVVTVESDEEKADEVLRREMAMGSQQGILVTDAAYGKGIASVLKAVSEKGSYDLILTGAQADGGEAQVGGMLAAMLDRPYASLVNMIEVIDDGKLKIGREIEGGDQEVSEIDLPCVLSIQTGINEPRYVSLRGIRKVSSVEIPEYRASDLGLSADEIGIDASKVKRVDYFVPDLGEGAEMIEGSMEEKVNKVIELLKSKGGMS